MGLELQRSGGVSGTTTSPTVFVVDADPSTREMLSDLIYSAGWQPKTFASAEEFLRENFFQGPGCLVLDVSLPGLSGLELQQLLGERQEMPLIFVTRDVSVATTVRAMKAGAVEFLTKPFPPETILGAMRSALARSRTVIDQEAKRKIVRHRYETLSARERQVMALVVGGLLNKQVGGQLGIAEITVKRHRGRVMRKMAATSFAHLVNVAVMLQLTAMP